MRFKHKFGAKPTNVDGIRFDSKLESRYYQKLKLLQASGELVFFTRQSPFHLPGNVRYVVDFVEYWASGDVIFTDVKGIDTPLSKTKRKLVEDLYPVQINIVTKA